MNADIVLKVFWSIVVSGVLFSIIIIVRRFLQDRDDVRIKEINLEGERIKFETHNGPIDKLIDDSNKSHGVVGDASRTDVEKK